MYFKIDININCNSWIKVVINNYKLNQYTSRGRLKLIFHITLK